MAAEEEEEAYPIRSHLWTCSPLDRLKERQMLINSLSNRFEVQKRINEDPRFRSPQIVSKDEVMSSILDQELPIMLSLMANVNPYLAISFLLHSLNIADERRCMVDV